ncbi:MAG TPA: hypothetical protein VGG45_11015 [Terracidiphilus sp.]|jgi:hypothetical protein
MPKRPRDLNQLAKLIVDIASGQAEDKVSEKMRIPAPQQKGGIKGGNARASALTDEQRAEIAKIAARARWKKQD